MPNLLTTTEAANSLGITPRRVLALIKAGRLPATRFGRDWQIRASDLDSVRERKPGRPHHIALTDAVKAAIDALLREEKGEDDGT